MHYNPLTNSSGNVPTSLSVFKSAFTIFVYAVALNAFIEDKITVILLPDGTNLKSLIFWQILCGKLRISNKMSVPYRETCLVL